MPIQMVPDESEAIEVYSSKGNPSKVTKGKSLLNLLNDLMPRSVMIKNPIWVSTKDVTVLLNPFVSL